MRPRRAVRTFFYLVPRSARRSPCRRRAAGGGAGRPSAASDPTRALLPEEPVKVRVADRTERIDDGFVQGRQETRPSRRRNTRARARKTGGTGASELPELAGAGGGS